MKKYLAMLFLLTVLLIPLNAEAFSSSRRSFIDYPRQDNENIDDNITTRTNPLYDDDLDDDNDLDNQTRDNGLLNNDDNNRNDNGILGITDDLDTDLDDDNDNLVTYIIIGLAGIVLGAFGSYLFIKRD